MHEIRHFPELNSWIARDAVVTGDVVLGPECTIWHHAVIRGDVAPIRLGRRVNVQDHAVLHCHGGVPLEIADEVTIGHQAVVHCAYVGTNSLIGIRSCVLDEARIGCDCIVAAGAVVVPRTVVPDGSVVMGAPARVVRPTTEKDRTYIRLTIEAYVTLAKEHAAGSHPPLAERFPS